MDYTIDAILQARILEWVAFPFSRGFPNPGIKPTSPALQADSLPAEPQLAALTIAQLVDQNLDSTVAQSKWNWEFAWTNDCRTEWTKCWAPTHKYVAICVAILPAQQFSSFPPLACSHPQIQVDKYS